MTRAGHDRVLDRLVACGYRARSLDPFRETLRRIAYGREARLDELLQPTGPDALNSAGTYLLLTAPDLDS